MATLPLTPERRQAARHHTARLREAIKTPTAPTLTPAPTAVSPVATGSVPKGSRPPSSTTTAKPLSANPLKSVGERLQRPRSRVSRLSRQAGQLGQLDRRFREALPTELTGKVTLAFVGSDYWLLQTDSPAWATRLRYSLPRLKQRLTEQLQITVPTLRIRVNPTGEQPPQTPPRQISVSTRTAGHLKQAADNIRDHQLSGALQRLAEHARQRAGRKTGS